MPLNSEEREMIWIRDHKACHDCSFDLSAGGYWICKNKGGVMKNDRELSGYRTLCTPCQEKNFARLMALRKGVSMLKVPRDTHAKLMRIAIKNDLGVVDMLVKMVDEATKSIDN